MVGMALAKSLTLLVFPPLGRKRLASRMDAVGQGAGVDLTVARRFQNIRQINYYLAKIDWRITGPACMA
jgi:hypothetical protein